MPLPHSTQLPGTNIALVDLETCPSEYRVPFKTQFYLPYHPNKTFCFHAAFVLGGLIQIKRLFSQSIYSLCCPNLKPLSQEGSEKAAFQQIKQPLDSGTGTKISLLKRKSCVCSLGPVRSCKSKEQYLLKSDVSPALVVVSFQSSRKVCCPTNRLPRDYLLAFCLYGHFYRNKDAVLK